MPRLDQFPCAGMQLRQTPMQVQGAMVVVILVGVDGQQILKRAHGRGVPSALPPPALILFVQAIPGKALHPGREGAAAAIIGEVLIDGYPGCLADFLNLFFAAGIGGDEHPHPILAGFHEAVEGLAVTSCRGSCQLIKRVLHALHIPQMTTKITRFHPTNTSTKGCPSNARRSGITI